MHRCLPPAHLDRQPTLPTRRHPQSARLPCQTPNLLSPSSLPTSFPCPPPRPSCLPCPSISSACQARTPGQPAYLVSEPMLRACEFQLNRLASPPPPALSGGSGTCGCASTAVPPTEADGASALAQPAAAGLPCCRSCFICSLAARASVVPPLAMRKPAHESSNCARVLACCGRALAHHLFAQHSAAAPWHEDSFRSLWADAAGRFWEVASGTIQGTTAPAHLLYIEHARDHCTRALASH